MEIAETAEKKRKERKLSSELRKKRFQIARSFELYFLMAKAPLKKTLLLVSYP